MKKMIKNFIKCVIVYIVISMTILSTISCGYSSAEVGDAVAGYTLNVLTWGNKRENYCDGLGGYGPALRYNQLGTQGKNRSSHPTLSDPNPETPWFYDCSSFTAAMYNMVCNKEILPWGSTCSTIAAATSVVEYIGPVGDGSSCKPGDIICDPSSHVEIFISQELGTGGAHTNNLHGDVNGYSNSDGQVNCRAVDNGYKSISPSNGGIYRIKETAASQITDLNTEFSMGTASSLNGEAIDYSNFFFNGIPDGKYSLASRKSIFQIIVDALSALLDFFVGLLTYLIRGVIISFISVFDRLINNTIGSMNGEVKTLKEAGIDANDADDPTSINRHVTIEGLVFGDEDMDVFDVNIFRVD